MPKRHIMLAPAREYFIKDGNIIKAEHFDPSLIKRRNTVYEVIRLMEGKAIFLNEHLERLMSSLLKHGITFGIEPGRVRNCISNLIEVNPAGDGNILFCVAKTAGHLHVMSWYVPHHYPRPEDYENGVRVHSIKAVRKNPNVKVWNAALRKRTAYLKESLGVYEILLIDNENNITECSRSNIFLLRGERVYTPSEDLVLPGITRDKVISICRDRRIPLEESRISYKELNMYESVLITGTSPKVLPVSQIDNFRFNTAHPVLQLLIEAYDELLMQELK